MTKNEWDILCYRRARLNNKLQQLSAVVSARWGNAAQSLRRNGCFSPAAAAETEAALLSARELLAEESGEAAELEFYGDLVYCALRLLESGTGWMDWTDGKSWDDLVELVDSFPALGELAYQTITQDDTDPWEKPDEEMETLMREFYETMSEATLQEQEAAGMVETVDADEALMERLEREAEIGQWLDAFQDKETFCARYRRCREAGRKHSHWSRVVSAVEDMVDVYLYDKGLSGFLSDDLYFLAYGLLDKAQVQLRSIRGEEPL